MSKSKKRPPDPTISGRNRRSLAPLVWSFAVLVGLSRVVLGVHYPSDVLAGAAIGIATGGVTWWVN